MQVSLSGRDHGEISHQTEDVNIRKSWKIQVSTGKKVTLIMNLMTFEFEEDCPYDYIEVRDGDSASSRLIGRYCRSPSNMQVTSSSNTMYVMHKSDATFSSHFKLIYTATEGRKGI